MLRNRAVALLLCCTASTLAFAVGLGSLQSKSALNEPFSGRIEILGATANDFDTLTVSLAPAAQFQRAGIALLPVLSTLRFSIEDTGSGKDYITVTSREPIREPFLNFLLEVNWLNGRLVREYTVLLDPPLYDPNRRRVATVAAPQTAVPTPATPAASPSPVATPPTAAPRTTTASRPYSAGNEIGPVQSGQTLWSLAAAHRPDAAVTVQQMMLALLRENPEAFADGNVNRLRRGAVLRLPDAASLQAVSAREAFAEVQRQHEVWQGYRSQAAAAPAPQPVGAPAPGAAVDTPPATSAGEARLELVAPDAEAPAGEATGLAATGSGEELLREEVDTQAQLAADLESKLVEAEEIIDILQRQVNIKDEELAALQARLVELGLEEAALPAASAPAEPAAAEPAETESPAAEPAAGAPVEAEPVEAEPAAAAPAAAEPAPEAPARPFPASLVPEHIAALVPGGSLTILGALAALLVGIVAGVFVPRMRRRRATAQPAAAAAAVAVPALATSGTADVTAAPTELPEEHEPELEPVFDPDATLEAEAVDHEAPTLIGADAEPEEDPLEEVNVYLAYERFDQAEELVKRVIQQYPHRHDYKLRLLEVYYSANNVQAYEGAARELREAIGEDEPLWGSAVAMWREMSPERDLFAAGAVSETATPAVPASAFVDITGDTGDQAVGEDTVSHLAGVETADAGLDFDIASGSESTSEIVDLTAGMAETDEVIDLTGGGDAEAAPATPAADDTFDITGTATATGDSDADVLDISGESDTFDITGAGEGEVEPEGVLELTGGGEAEAAAPEATELLDITGGGLDLDLTDTAPMEPSPRTGRGDDDTFDVTGTGAHAGVLDLTSLEDTHSGADLLDVTHTGDISSVDDRDLLNVTSPGPHATASESTDADLDVTDLGSGALDFDVGAATADTEEQLAEFDLSAGTPEEDELLDFDIGGLADAGPGADEARAAAPDVGAGAVGRGDGDLDFDLTIDGDALTGGLTVEEKEDATGRVEITMSALGPDNLDGELSLQGDELDELALDAPGGADDFDLALDGTVDMYSVAAEDTIDMAAVRPVPPERDGEVGEEFNLDTVEIEAYETDNADHVTEAHAETVAMEREPPMDRALEDDQTVAMTGGEDFELALDVDDADTKLNLAKAYIELGDTAGARAILDEVTADGNPDQQSAARTLLEQLGD